MKRPWVIIPAAGAGRRMQSEVAKQYLPLAGRPVIAWTLERLLRIEPQAVVLVLAAGDDYRYPDPQAPILYVQGGRERCHSVAAGLQALASLAQDDDCVLVHDAARPCVRHEDLQRLLLAAQTSPDGALLAAAVRDTMKRADAAARVVATVDRSHMWHALTPQAFAYGELSRLLQQALAQGQLPGDEAGVFEAAGRMPQLVAGAHDNIKITYPADIALAAAILRAQQDTES